jgi:hypothetical protein
MTIKEPHMSIEMAKIFHDTYERLAPSFGYETRKDTKVFDPESPNGKLMAAVCGEVVSAVLTETEADKTIITELENQVASNIATIRDMAGKLAELEGQPSWPTPQPMETAPKDEKPILIWLSLEKNWVRIPRADDLLYKPFYLHHVTHWLPLPPDPQ